MEDKQEDYYILCGWMAEDDVDKFVEEVKEDDKVFVVVEDDHDAYFGEPPTKLEIRNYSNHLKCSSVCMDSRHITRWIRRCLSV